MYLVKINNNNINYGLLSMYQCVLFVIRRTRSKNKKIKLNTPTIAHKIKHSKKRTPKHLP